MKYFISTLAPEPGVGREVGLQQNERTDVERRAKTDAAPETELEQCWFQRLMRLQL